MVTLVQKTSVSELSRSSVEPQGATTLERDARLELWEEFLPSDSESDDNWLVILDLNVATQALLSPDSTPTSESRESGTGSGDLDFFGSGDADLDPLVMVSCSCERCRTKSLVDGLFMTGVTNTGC